MARRLIVSGPDWLGIALAAAGGLAAGVLAGLVVGELLGDVDSDRVRRAVRGFKPERDAEPDDHVRVGRAVEQALAAHPTTRPLAVRVRALGDGVVELTGRAPDALARRTAGQVAEGVDGADVVVNRILVEGADVPPARSPSNAG